MPGSDPHINVWNTGGQGATMMGDGWTGSGYEPSMTLSVHPVGLETMSGFPP